MRAPSKKLSFQKFVAGALLVASGRASVAQEEVSVELLTIAMDGVIKGLQFESGGEVQEMDIYSRGFAPPAEYKGSRELTFFRLVAPADDSAEAARRVVGHVTLPAGAERVLLLFEKDGDADAERYSVRALPNDPEGFPGGAYRFFNFTEQALVGSSGDERWRMAPGADLVVRPEGDENGNFELKIAGGRGADAKPLFSSVWAVKKSRRTCVFLLPTKSRIKGVEVRKFNESAAPRGDGG